MLRVVRCSLADRDVVPVLTQQRPGTLASEPGRQRAGEASPQGGESENRLVARVEEILYSYPDGEQPDVPGSVQACHEIVPRIHSGGRKAVEVAVLPIRDGDRPRAECSARSDCQQQVGASGVARPPDESRQAGIRL